MVRTSLHELWEDDGTTDWTSVWYIIGLVAVRTVLIATRLVDLCHIAVVRVLVAYSSECMRRLEHHGYMELS